MLYKEEKKDLFSVPDEYYLAHCISADFGMGKGIVVEFNKRYDMKNILKEKYPDYVKKWHKTAIQQKGDCILEGRVFNLITKERYWMKPTYDTLANALIKCSLLCKQHNITKLAMPIIGCDLDRLKWENVSEIVKAVFKDMDIEIWVCMI